ncbi:hypothetical protein R1flu_017084 [Riccia fluitans]|uniref:Uncharacterized protein n=1 Tax=Riccia fluitans TaxID=41844 RepID=A0ABD1YNZ3_9MARC
MVVHGRDEKYCDGAISQGKQGGISVVDLDFRCSSESDIGAEFDIMNSYCFGSELCDSGRNPMDKPKSKDNLRAAGKKRLEEFRQKKQQKSAATKTTGTALKVLAGDDKELPSASSSPRNPNHDESQFRSVETDQSHDDSVPSTHKVPQATGDSDKEVTYADENHHIARGGNIDYSTIPDENNDSPSTNETSGISPASQLVDGRNITEEASRAGAGEYTSESTVSLEGANSREEDSRMEDSPEDENYSRTPHQSTISEGSQESEAPSLSPLAQISVDREKGPSEVSREAEQKSENAREAKTLLSEIESLQLQLRISQQEKERSSVDLQAAQAELQIRTGNAAQEQSTTREALTQSELGDFPPDSNLDTAKREIVQVNGEVVSELERLQKRLTDKETEAMEMKEELASYRDKLVQLEEERSSLMSEVGQYHAELEALGQEKVRLTSELETSHMSVRSMELEKEELISERDSSAQQVRAFIQKNERVTNELIESVEKLQTLELTNKHEREVSRVQIESIAAENSRLAKELDVEKTILNGMRVEKAQLLADISLERVQLEEAVAKLQTSELAKTYELETLKEQVENFEVENVRLGKKLDAERESVNSLRMEKNELLADIENEREVLIESVEKLRTSGVLMGRELEECRIQIKSITDENARLAKELESERACVNETREQKSQILADLSVRSEELRESAGRLEATKVTKERDLEACRVQIASISTENLRLAKKLDAETACLNEMRAEKDQLLYDLNAKSEELRESVEKLETSKVSKDRELEACRVQIASITTENVRLSEELDVERECVDQGKKYINDLNVKHEELRKLYEKLQLSGISKDHELEACRVQTASLTAENVRLSEELDAERACVHEMRVEKEHLLTVEHAKLEHFAKVEIELLSEVKALKALMQELRSEHSNFLSVFNTDVISVELQKIEAAYADQASQHTESRHKLQAASEDHARSVNKLEIALDECSRMLDFVTEEKNKLTNELIIVKSQLVVHTEEGELAISTIRTELQESKELVKMAEEQNGSLVKLLEEARSEMQRVVEENARSVSKLESELDKQKLLFEKEVEEKARLFAELQEMRQQLDSTHLSLSDRQTDMDRNSEELKQLGEHRTKLSKELVATMEELTRLQEEKSQAAAEMSAAKKQIDELERGYSACLEKLENTEAELRNVREHGLEQFTEMQVELEKERSVRTELSQEKDKLAAKLQDLQEQHEILQQEMEASIKSFRCEILKHEERSREIGEDRNKLSDELSASRDELSKAHEERSRVEEDLQSCRVRLARLEEDIALLLETHRHENAAHEDSMRKLDESRGVLKSELLACQDELTKLRVEKDDLRQELVVQTETLRTIEALNKDLAGELAEVKLRADVHVQDKALLQAEHGSEVARLQEELYRLEGLNAASTSDIVQLLSDLQGLKKEKDFSCSQVEILKEDCRRLGEEKSKLADDLLQTKDQVQLIVRDEELRHTMLKSELEHHREQAERLSEEKTTLLEELEVTRENLRGVSNQKMNEIEMLLRQVEELTQSKAQAVNELAAAFERAEKVEKTRMELASKLEAVEQQLQDLMRDKDSLLTDLDMSRQQPEELGKEKAELLPCFQDSLNDSKTERSDLEQATEVSAEKDGMAVDLALTERRRDDMPDVQTRASAEFGCMKESLQSSDEIGQSADQLNARDEQDRGVSPDDVSKQKLLGESGELSSSGRSFEPGETVHSVDDLEEMKRQIATKEGELAHLKTQYTLLETKLESADGERHVLAQELVTLRQQLQQLSESKSHVANELALGVEASRQRMLEYEESKSESVSEMKKSKQDLQSLGEEDRAPWQGSQVLQGQSVELTGVGLKKRSPISRCDDSVALGSGVSKLIGEFERKAHAGQEQAEQLRRAVHENMRLTASVQRLESERHMLVDAPAQIADLQRQLEHLDKQIAELRAEKDAAVGALLAAQAELRESKEIVKEGNSVLADRLVVLEESVISLRTERDVLSGSLVEMEKSLTPGSDNSLKDEGTSVEIVPASDGMRGNIPVDSNNLRFLIAKLEHAVLETFPDSASELVSLRVAKPAFEYWETLCDKLLNGDTGVCHQLQKAHLQLTDIRQLLTQSEEKLVIVQQERDSVVQATQGYADQLAKELADKAAVQAEVSALQARIDELESSLTLETNSRSVVDNDLRSIISKYWGDGADVEQEVQSLQQRYETREFELSTVTKKLEVAVKTVTQQADEIKGLLLQTDRLSEELEKMAAEKESFQSSITQAEQKLSLTREKLSMAVNKGKAVVQQRDALKQTLAEKTKLLEDLKITHEQVLHMKDVTLQNMEAKLSELEAFKDEYIQLETRCSFLQEVVSTAEKALEDKDHLVEELSSLLECPMSIKDWHACELVEKIVWITNSTSKVLQIVEASKGEVGEQALTSTSQANYSEEVQARAETLAHELSVLKLEKEELVSHFQDIKSSLQSELEQKISEKSHLTSMIRKLDSDLETLRQGNESMSRRLEEQASGLAEFESEISALQKKLAEREEQWHHEVLRHQKLQANVHTVATNLVDIHQSLPPFEGDVSSAQSSLAWCKKFIHILVGRYNLIVEKLDEFAYQSAESTSTSMKPPSDTLSNKPVDQLSLRSVSTELIKEVEEIFALVEKQAGEATTLLRRIEKQADELAAAEAERLRLQQELSTSEQRSSTIREKLSSAVTKGKSVVQQRDALKQALAEKNDELATLMSSHKKELQERDALLHETCEKLDAARDRIDNLEKQLTNLKTSSARDMEPASADKVRELERVLTELQSKDALLHDTNQKLDIAMERVNSLEKELATFDACVERDEKSSSIEKINELKMILAETELKLSSAEAEAGSSRKGADEAAFELKQCQKTIETLSAKSRSLTEERDSLVSRLESSTTQHKDEVEEFLDEREKLVTTIGELENIISRQKDDMESLMRNFEELSESYNSLNAQSIEDATETTNLQDEINSLHNHIAELELAMEMEAAARQKLEADSDAVVASIQEVIQDSWVGLSGKNSPSSDSTSLLEEICSLLIGRYKAVTQEVEELTEQVSVLSNLEETSKAKTLSEEDSLFRMQQMLQTKDVELSELSTRMEDAAIEMAKQEDVVQGLMQQVGKLRGERDALQAELELAEQRTASCREKLTLAVKKGKNVVQQRDALKQTLAEQEAILAHCKEKLELKESMLAKLSEDLVMSDKQVQDLESEVAALRKHSSTLEHDLQDKSAVIAALETSLGSHSTANEWRSKKLPQKVNWLVSAIADADSKASSSSREVEALRRESSQLHRQLSDAQYQAETLEKESAQLGSQLRDAQYQAEVSKKESTQLGTQLRDVQNQVEVLKRESSQLGSQLTDAQYQAECDKETMSVLTRKLEKTENELHWSQLRSAELEAQLPALVSAHQQADTLSSTVRTLEALLEQKDEEIRNLESVLKQKDGSIRDLESTLEQKKADIKRAEEAVYAWAGRSEETEAYIHGSQMRISELETQLRTLSEVQQHAEQLADKVRSLEEILQQKESALKTSEASRTKTANKLTTTRSKFRELCHQSEGLVAELERMQGSVESKDIEIKHMKEDVGRSRALAQVLQARLDSRNALLTQLEEKLRTSWAGENEFSPSTASRAYPNEDGHRVEGEEVFTASVKMIQRRLEALVAQSQSWQTELTKKDSQLQGLRRELDEANGERTSLKASLHKEKTLFEQFKAEHASKYSPAADRDSLKVEDIEAVQVGNRSMPSTSAAPHVRGTRKPPSFDVAIDMDFESSRLLEASDEKGHGFKALGSARFMPRGTRFIADRIDRICVAGGRLPHMCSRAFQLFLSHLYGSTTSSSESHRRNTFISATASKKIHRDMQLSMQRHLRFLSRKDDRWSSGLLVTRRGVFSYRLGIGLRAVRFMALR